MSDILLDTNLLIYAIDEDSKYHLSIQKLLEKNNLNFFTTSKNISEFLAVVTRYPNKSLSIDDALLIIEDFVTNFTILYPSKESFSIFMDRIFFGKFNFHS